MLVFNEGLPRAGKSYDAVKSHILPALKAGRTVFARLNGLVHEKIAAYLEMDVDRVRELLILVPTKDVRETFRAVSDPQEGWTIPDRLKNALFVVDEAHEFYVADRAPIDPALEQFFALHGQNGMDGVLLSQYYRRLHSSVRCRVERKNVFQKLSAVALDNSYLVTRYHAVGPDSYEPIGSETCRYDASIFPLYRGYAPGASNTAVYKAGGRTVWARLAKYGIVMAVLVSLGVWTLFHFLHGGASDFVKQPAHVAVARHPSFTRKASAAPGEVLPVIGGHGGAGTPLQPRISDADLDKMPDTVRYVFALCQQVRPRLAASGRGPLGEFGVVEWPQSGGDPLERLTFAQLRAMAVGVQVTDYGVRLWYRKSVVIVTSWPLSDSQGSQEQAANASPPVQSAAVSRGAPSPGARASASGWPARPVVNYSPPEFATDPHVQSLGQYGNVSGG